MCSEVVIYYQQNEMMEDGQPLNSSGASPQFNFGTQYAHTKKLVSQTEAAE